MTPLRDGPEIVAIGEAMIEFNQVRAEAPESYVRGFGGDTSNMAIAAARLGARTGYVTRVGDDAFGRMLLRLWSDEASIHAARSADHEIAGNCARSG